MEPSERTIAWCALNRIFGYHPRLAAGLVEEAGGPLELFSGSPPELPSHPELTAQLTPDALEWARKELQEIREAGFLFLDRENEAYPALLLECDDPPLGLYVNGSTPPGALFGFRPAVAIVGTRDVSPYGKAWCIRLVKALSDAAVRPVIVSGLAFGTDGIAHKCALEAGLPTIGVMATGIEQVYPWQHTELAAEIVRTPECALVTDYPRGTAPVALNFLRRNRIIAGLSRAVIVVESKTKGGSLMTARYACEYNRDVFALPGRADDIRSAGCNSLIRNQMAEIITTPEDLVTRLGLGLGRRRKKEGLDVLLVRRYGAESPLRALALKVQELGGAAFAELSAELGWTYSQVAQQAGILESDGIVETDLLQRCSIAKNFM
ncbi:MAG: DNA-processing protein DprA [Bacteroidales bacterium]|nr:DNA-processing protein DprA [Bacteroidales bacterium]